MTDSKVTVAKAKKGHAARPDGIFEWSGPAKGYPYRFAISYCRTCHYAIAGLDAMGPEGRWYHLEGLR